MHLIPTHSILSVYFVISYGSYRYLDDPLITYPLSGETISQRSLSSHFLPDGLNQVGGKRSGLWRVRSFERADLAGSVLVVLGLSPGELDESVGGEMRTRRIVMVDAITAVLVHPHDITTVAVILFGAVDGFLPTDHGSCSVRW